MTTMTRSVSLVVLESLPEACRKCGDCEQFVILFPYYRNRVMKYQAALDEAYCATTALIRERRLHEAEVQFQVYRTLYELHLESTHDVLEHSELESVKLVTL